MNWKAKLGKVKKLGDEDLGGLEREMMDRYAELRDGDVTDEALAEIEEIADGLDVVRNEAKERIDAAEARAEKLAKLEERIAPPSDEDEEEEDEEEEDETEDSSEDEEDEDETEDSSEDDDEEEEEPKRQAASAKRTTTPPVKVTDKRGKTAVAASTRVSPSKRREPKEASKPKPFTIIAGSNMAPRGGGLEYDSIEQAGAALADKLDQMRRSNGQGGQPHDTLLTFKLNRDESKKFTVSNSERNSDLVAEDARRFSAARGVKDYRALVAAGGYCAPPEVDYNVLTIGETDTPFEDGFFTQRAAERGRITFQNPPTLANINNSAHAVTAKAGIVVWTAANDANPGSNGPSTKPIARIECGDQHTCVVDAVPLRWSVGNFNARTFRERVDAALYMMRVAYARVTETYFLDAVDSHNGAPLTAAPVYDIVSDTLDTWAQLSTAIRSERRMAENATLTVATPFWLFDAMVAALSKMMPGDGLDRFNVADATIRAWLAARDLEVSTYMDTATGRDQIYEAQVPGAAVRQWKAKAFSYFSHPGAWYALDGGELNLGTDIRDTTLIATNDVQGFMERFMGACFNGHFSYTLDQTICVSGSSAALTTAVCDTDPILS